MYEWFIIGDIIFVDIVGKFNVGVLIELFIGCIFKDFINFFFFLVLKYIFIIFKLVIVILLEIIFFNLII